MMKENARTQQNRNIPRGRRGESMIMVAVMLMVFVILGAAVLTASSSASATSSARISERQAYYYARSLLDVLDESMRKGKLGTALRDGLMDKLVSSNLSAVQYDETPFTLTYQPSLTAEPLTEVTFSPVTIQCTGKAESNTGAVGGAITRASLQLRTVDVSFTVTYREQSVAMHIQYRCSYNVESYNATTKQGTWTQDWAIQLVN